MNFQKLFFYVALVSLSLSSLATAAMRSDPLPLIRDSDKDITLVYADGSLNPAVSKIVLKRSLKTMWGEENSALVEVIAVAHTPQDRAKAIIANKEVGMWAGVNGEAFDALRKIYRPAPPVMAKRPKDGAPMRAPEPESRTLPKAELMAMFAQEMSEEDMGMDYAATKIQSNYRGMKARRDVARIKEIRQEFADRGSDLEEMEAAKAAADAAPLDMAGYNDAKRQWQHDHRSDGGKGKFKKMIKALRKQFPREVARDMQYRK